jgi:hypothetical protein
VWGYDVIEVSLSSFFVTVALYIVLFGVVAGGSAAWLTRSGSTPLREMVSAFRSRAGSRATPPAVSLGGSKSDPAVSH